jgi:hypothetical protein
MAENKKSFILYTDQSGVFNQLPDEMAGKLIKHIFAYVNDENPITEDLIINIAFEPIKQSLKRDLQRWNDYIEKQSLNGKKGGRPSKANETQKTQAFLEKPKKADSVSVSDSVNDNVKKFIKPTENDIRAYMIEQGMQDESTRFYNYYEANGWKVGRNPMKNWKAAVITWKKNQPQQQPVLNYKQF